MNPHHQSWWRFLSVPIFGNRKFAAVRAYFITGLESSPIAGRCTHHTSAPVIHSYFVLKNNRLVHINRSSVLLCSVFLDTINIPAWRNRNIIPSRDIKFCFVKVFGPFFGIWNPIEFPVSIQWLPVSTVFRQYFPGTCLILEREEIGMRLFFVQRQIFRGFPFIPFWSLFRGIMKAFQRFYFCIAL